MNTPKLDTRFVFDLAGVLLDWNPLPVYTRLLGGDAAQAGHFLTDVMGEEPQRAISAGVPPAEVLARQARTHPQYRDAIFAWETLCDEVLRGPIDGSLAVLGELRERGYSTYALGNWSRAEFERARARFDFLDGFDDVLLSGDVGALKPDPAIFAHAEVRFGLTPAQTVFIDDRADNAQAAIARGWNALVFEHPRQLYLVLMEYGFL